MNLFERIQAVAKLPNLFRYGRELRQRESWTVEKMKDFQAGRLWAIVKFCYERVPFYRRLWSEHGVNISQIQAPEDITILPCINKDDLKNNAEELVPDGMSKIFLNAARTGGSTGSPANFYMTMNSRLLEHAFFLRYWRWHGMSWWRSRKVFLRGRYAAPKKDIRRDWTNGYWISAFDLTDEKLRRYANFIVSKKIEFLLAYPSLAERLASVVAQDEDIQNQIRLKKVFCASEKLYPLQRNVIEKVFRCPLRIHYGHGELAALFQQCPVGNGYHVISDYGYVEFGPADEETGLREIIATGFNNSAAPLVRYRTGDYVRLRPNDSCTCGLPFPKLVEDVEGRSGDIIVTPSGRYIQPNHLEYAIRHITHFSDCQVIQDSPSHLTVLVVPEEGYVDAEGQAFAEGIQSRIREHMDITVKIVDAIERPMNQKRRFIVSKIGQKLLSEGR